MVSTVSDQSVVFRIGPFHPFHIPFHSIFYFLVQLDARREREHGQVVIVERVLFVMVMQAATRATLLNLVEQHVTALVRECAVINRHSKRSGFVSAADGDGDRHPAEQDDDDDDNDAAVGDKRRKKRRKRRLLIHHDDVNLALAWRGSEKLYASGVPLALSQQTPPHPGGATTTTNTNAAVTDDDDEIKGKRKRSSNISTLGHLLRTTTTPPITTKMTTTDNNNNNNNIPTLLASSTVPRIDLNAYLHSELMVRPPSELGMTLHWLAVEGVMPMIPANEVWNRQQQDNNALVPDIIPALLLLDQNENDNAEDDTTRPSDNNNNDNSSIVRIRELQQRLLSEELQLYYSHITKTISNPNLTCDDLETLSVISSICNGGQQQQQQQQQQQYSNIQELVPFLCRFVVSELLSRRNLRNTAYCVKLVRVVNAMLDNSNLHLDLHLHQLFIPLGTCVVAKNLSNTVTTSTSSQFHDHWSLREEAAKCLVKACNIYGDQYTTMRPRLIKLLTQQALRRDRPLATQYGGIVGISLFGPRAIDAFILPLAREYWECWEEELRTLSAATSIRSTHTDGRRRDGDTTTTTTTTTPESMQRRAKANRRDAEGREYDLHMCQRALLSSIHIFMQNVTNAEKSKRVDIRAFMDVFGERLIPMQPDITDYMAAVV